MSKTKPHYLPDGKLYKGETHKAGTKLMTGAVHEATTTASKFSGPAGPTIDTFTYQLTLVQKEKIAPGTATLLATIKYACGSVSSPC